MLWPATAAANITITDVQWLSGGVPTGITFHAVPAGEDATLRVTVALTGSSDWNKTAVKVGTGEWVVFSLPDPAIICPGPNCVPPFVTDVSFNPQDLMGPDDQPCDQYPVFVAALDRDGSIIFGWDEDEWEGTLTLQVYDDAPPVITCWPDSNPFIAYLDAHGEVTILLRRLLTSYDDDCGMVYSVSLYGSPGQDSVTFTCADLGDQVVEIVAWDLAGNGSTPCAAHITVVDNLGPVIDCTPLTFPNDPGLCSSTQTIIPPVTDNCTPTPDIEITYQILTLPEPYADFVTNDQNIYHAYAEEADGPLFGFVFPVGVTTIKWSATDLEENESLCVLEVTVEDKQAPSITCGSNISIVKDSILPTNPDYRVCMGGLVECGVEILDIDFPAYSDNCTGSEFPTVLTIEIERLGIGPGSDPELANACYPIGETEIIWTATDAAGNYTSCTQKVTVTTDDPPEIFACEDVPPVCAGTTGYGGGNDVCRTVGPCEAWVNVCPPFVFDCCPPWIDAQHHGLWYLQVTHTAETLLPDGTIVPGPFGGCWDAPCYMDACGDDLLDCDNDGNIDAYDQDCEEAVNPLCKKHNNCDWNASGVYPVGTTTITWTVTNPITGLTGTTTQVIRVVDCTKPVLCCCTQCAAAPVIFTPSGSDTITPSALLVQLTQRDGYFPFVWQCSDLGCDPCTYVDFCKGGVWDNCPGVELLIIKGFDDDGNPILRPNSETYAYGMGGEWITIIAQDVAGNYSEDYCTLQIYVDKGVTPPVAPTGACCVGYDCEVLTQAQCAGKAGTYKGNNTPCESDTCGVSVVVVPPKLDKAPDETSGVNETPADDTTAPAGFFGFCGAQASIATTLLLVGLLGIKFSRRRR
jgi:hypothetical protein